jgi:hypothetical protein
MWMGLDPPLSGQANIAANKSSLLSTKLENAISRAEG